MSGTSSLRTVRSDLVTLGLMLSGASLLMSLVTLTMRGPGVTMEQLTR